MAPARDYGHFIDGARREPSTGEFIARRSPAHGALLAQFANGSEDDVDVAVKSARQAFNSGWSMAAGSERSAILNRFADLIEANQEALARIEAEEAGKPIISARFEVSAGAQLARYAAGLAWQLSGQVFNNLGENALGLVTREPCGVVGLITPWNFPILTLFQKLPYALAAGCSVVVKPSELTSGTTLEVASLAIKAGLPAGVFNVVTGTGQSVGSAMATHPDIDMISFTGSTRVGKEILRNASGTVKRVALELGGKAANIVFADADIDAALDGVLFGYTLNQGEECVAGARLLVESSIAEAFLEKLTARTSKLRVGHPLDETADISSLIHEQHLASVDSHVQHAVQQGARVLIGGRKLDGDLADGHFYAPTILAGVARDSAVFRDEVFGPVLTATTFETVEEAIDLANDTNYGLANGVWTKNIDKALSVARSLRSGLVFVNTYLETAPQLPFGGYKQSGLGRENGMDGLLEFTEVKSTFVKMGARQAILAHTIS